MRTMALAVILAGAPDPAAAASPPPSEVPAAAPAVGAIPEPWRAYLAAARAAEGIEDPLQRCLAFPDLPGNRWPAGHARAHCRHHFETKRPTLGEIEGMVQRGETAQLDAMFEQSLSRHFPAGDDGSGEAIHDTFNDLLNNGDARTDRVTASWLAQAPGSAFAQLARGSHLYGAARQARGGEVAAATPPENMRRMRELIEQATPYVRKSIDLNPRLLPAYTTLLAMGTMASRPDLEEAGIEGAQALDPACLELAKQRMRALTPRWGGSYEQMLALSDTLAGYVPQRPLLATQAAQPYADLGDRLRAAKRYEQGLDASRIAIAMSSDEDALHDAAVVAWNLDEATHGYETVAYLLQEGRFRALSAWSRRELAGGLVRAYPEWAMRYVRGALELEPDNAYAHFLAGAAHLNLGRFEEAEAEYRIASESRYYRLSSLYEIARMWVAVDSRDDTHRAKARPYIDRMLREFPEDGRGRLLDVLDMWNAKMVDVAAVRAAVEKADRNDPWQADVAGRLEGMLDRIEVRYPASR